MCTSLRLLSAGLVTLILASAAMSADVDLYGDPLPEGAVARIGAEMPPEILSFLRAVHALELMATPDARDLLRDLSKGDPAARETQAAKVALKRLVQKE
jgi:hypothetical protein